MRQILCISVLLIVPSLLTAAPPNYQQHIKPILRDHCLKCHNADEQDADLDLSTFAAAMKGGSSGPVLSAGRPDSSQLFRAISHAEGVEPMPPESPKIDVAKIKLVREWIQGGLIDGVGGKSQLRNVSQMAVDGSGASDSPMPANLEKLPPSKTARAPIPQAIAASPGAPLVAVAAHERISLISLASGKTEMLGELAFPEGTLHDLKFSRSGKILLAAGGRGAHSGKVVLFDVATGKRIGEVGDAVDSVLAADITADNQYVALGGTNKVVEIYGTKGGKVLHRIKKHTDWVTAMQFSPDGKYLATGDRSGGVYIWETEKGAIVYTMDEHKVRITQLDWRADGKVVATAADDGNLILWDMKDGWPLRNANAHTEKSASRYTQKSGVVAVDFLTDGRLITVGRDNTLHTWSADGTKLKSFVVDGDLPVAAARLHDNSAAVVGTFDGNLQVIGILPK